MPIDPAPTQRKLLDAALRLFAERGVDAVTLGEITRAAGQRNNSALQYHFGGREVLLRTLLQPFSDVVRARRFELLAAAGDEASPRVAAEVMVRPQAEFAAVGWRERAVSRIVADLLANPQHPYVELDALLGDRATDAMQALVESALRELPAPVISERLRVSTAAVVHAVSDWARHVDARGAGADRVPPTELFTENLVDMIEGSLGAGSHVGQASAVTGTSRP